MHEIDRLLFFDSTAPVPYFDTRSVKRRKNDKLLSFKKIEI